MKKHLSVLLILELFLGAPLLKSAMAQNGADEEILIKTQNDLMLIGAAGAGGAILGLSTLSFVEMPSKQIYNIWAGAAIGVIVGVVYVAYNSAQSGSEDLQSSQEFNSFERFAWHAKNTEIQNLPQAQFAGQLFQLNF
jgi:hypothetical protein